MHLPSFLMRRLVIGEYTPDAGAMRRGKRTHIVFVSLSSSVGRILLANLTAVSPSADPDT